MLFKTIWVTVRGAPDVILVAVVTSPVLAIKVPFGTKLNSRVIGTALAALSESDSARPAAGTAIPN